MSTVHIDGFEMVEKLGTGGMATVWKARQLSLDRIVAVKVLSSAFASDSADIERFQREAQAAARLKHHGIVQVYDANIQNGMYYFVMEYIAGYTVGDWMSRKGKLAEHDALLVAESVADALDYAWRQARVIHCDIKPDNIMVDADGSVKVADLGLARTLSAMTLARRSEDILGTPAYMSPEQVRGDAEIDCRADIYALGAMLYHVLTGKMLFEGTPEEQIADLQATETVPDPIDLNHALSRPVCWLIEKMLSKDPRYRQQDWAAVKADIDRVKRGVLPAGRKVPSGVSTVRRSKRRIYQKSAPAAAAQPQPGGLSPAMKFVMAIVVGLGAAALFMVVRGFLPQSPQGGGRQPGPAFQWTNAPTPQAAEDADNQRARALYDAAVRWGREHASQYGDGAQQFERVARETRGTKYALMAENEARRLRGEQRKAADDVLAKLDARVREPVAKGDFLAAARVYADYAGPLADATKDDRGRKAAELRKRQEDADRERDQRREAATSAVGGIMDRVAAEVAKNGCAAGLTALMESAGTNAPAGLRGELEAVRTVLQSACNINKVILDSFTTQVNTRVSVELESGKRRFTVLRVAESRVEVQERTETGAERTLSFGIPDLSLKERLERMGPDSQPQVSLVKGLLAFAAKSWESARGYFQKTHPLLAERLVAQVQRAEEMATNDAAERDLRRLLASLNVPIGDFDADGWARQVARHNFPSATTNRVAGLVAKYVAAYGATEFATRAKPVLDALQGIPPPGMEDVKPGRKDGGRRDVGTLTGQAREVMEKLLTANPDLKEDEVEVSNGDMDLVDTLSIRSAAIRDLRVVKDLPGLKVLRCIAEGVEKGKPEGLAGIGALRLQELAIENCRVSDVESLSHMPLKILSLRNTNVREATPLKGLKIESLDLSGTRVTDCAPLSDLPLETLRLNELPITSLDFAKGLPLKHIGLASTKIQDFSALAGKHLESADFRNTTLRSVGFLSDMPLKSLRIDNTRVNDISPLRANKQMTELTLGGCSVSDFAALKDKPLEVLDVSRTGFADPAMLAGKPLRELYIEDTKLADLSVLKEAKLEVLNIENTGVADISVLAGMPLRELRCRKTKIKDFAPLRDSPLQELSVDTEACPKDILNTMLHLKRVNGEPWGVKPENGGGGGGSGHAKQP